MEPYVIHIRMEAGPLARLQEEARRAGMAVYPTWANLVRI